LILEQFDGERSETVMIEVGLSTGDECI